MKKLLTFFATIGLLFVFHCGKDKTTRCDVGSGDAKLCYEISTGDDVTRFKTACSGLTGTTTEEACDTSGAKSKCENAELGQGGVTIYMWAASSAQESTCSTAKGTYSTI